MPSRERLLATTFVELADTLVADFDVIDFLHTLAARTVQLLDVSAAGIMLADQRGNLKVMASSTEEASILELFELQTDEGPCMDCFRSGSPVVATDQAGMREAWPAFTGLLQEVGFLFAQAIPLRLRDQTIGALNIFRRAPEPLSAADQAIAQALADVATVGLIQERAAAASDLLAGQLHRAYNGRILLEQAKGVLAERAGLRMDEAFTVMQTYAQQSGGRLSDVAASVVDGTVDGALWSALADRSS